MRTLFTGATGVIGRRAVPGLLSAGHAVSAVARNHEDTDWLRSIGAVPVSVDLFDADQVDAAVAGHDAIVHFATAIPPASAMRRRGAWHENDRLRSEATAHLVDAALRRGVPRFVQESVTLVYADGSNRWLGEDAPINTPWEVVDSALAAEAHVARYSQGGGAGVVLRLSRLYGTGRASTETVAGISARKIPVVGRGDNWVSSLFHADAASALVAAIEAPAGTYNVTDDHPVTSSDYWGLLALALGARSPRRIPRWLAQIVAGGAAALLTVSQRVSSARFREATGWRPSVPSVHEGWPQVAAAVEDTKR